MNVHSRIRSISFGTLSLYEICMLAAGVVVATIMSSTLYARGYLEPLGGYDYVASPLWTSAHLLSIYGPIGIAQVSIFRRFVTHAWRWVVGEMLIVAIAYPLLTLWLIKNGHHDMVEALAFFDLLGINPFLIIAQWLIVQTWARQSVAFFWLILNTVGKCFTIPVVFPLAGLFTAMGSDVGFVFFTLVVMVSLETYMLTWMLSLSQAQRVKRNN